MVREMGSFVGAGAESTLWTPRIGCSHENAKYAMIHVFIFVAAN